MHGEIDLQAPQPVFRNEGDAVVVSFAEFVSEKFRCFLAHGEELPNGSGVSPKVSELGMACFLEVSFELHYN